MYNNPAISNLIRNGKAYQIDSVIAAEKEDMMTMDNCLIDYYKKGIISFDTLKHFAVNLDLVLKKL
jgi:twitching motility protein PilT